MNPKDSKVNRRSFLKLSGSALATGGVGLMISNPAKAACYLDCSINEYNPKDYTKFLNPAAKVAELTESGRKNLSRDRIMQSVLDKIPTADRVEQITSIILKHIDAEERNHVEDTMATLDPNPIFESIPEGAIYQGHKAVQDDYKIRYQGMTRTLHITNLTVDTNGAFAEMLWEGQQVDTYKGFKPVENAKKFFLPMIVYYEVTSQGLIKRESVYYDQYLGLLSLELIPDILKNSLDMLALNKGLIFRKF